jgi:hypothetical protein
VCVSLSLSLSLCCLCVFVSVGCTVSVVSNEQAAILIYGQASRAI